MIFFCKLCKRRWKRESDDHWRHGDDKEVKEQFILAIQNGWEIKLIHCARCA